VNKYRANLYTIAALVLAGGFLYLALRHVSWEEIKKVVITGKLDYLVWAFLLFIAGLPLRVYRWVLITRSESGIKKVHFPFAFWAYGAGSLANNLFPARAGDLLRAVVTGQKTHLTTAQALASVIAERVLDSILLLIIASFALLGIPSFREALPKLTGTVIMVVIGFIVSILIYSRYAFHVKRFFNQFPLPFIGWDKLFNFVDHFIEGFRVLRSPKQVVLILAFSMVIWSWDAGVTMVLSRAFDINLNIIQSFALLSALGLSSALPSTPGYVGVYQFVAVAILAPFGVPESRALVHILAYQLITYLIVFIWGGVGLMRLNLGFYVLGHVRNDFNAEE
jgi:glycosyltransferase 2 family protein